MQTRQTAYKLWIAEIVGADYIREVGEWEPNYLEIKELKVARVNVLGVITDFFISPSGEYATCNLEDGSASIAIRAFKEDVRLLTEIKMGDPVMIIGRPKQYQSEIYLIPEIVKPITNDSWMKIRKAELIQSRGAMPQPHQVPKKVEEDQTMREDLIATNASIQGNESVRQKVLNVLEKQGELGMDVDLLIKESGIEEEQAEKIVEDLIKEGEIYMSRPGVLKII